MSIFNEKDQYFKNCFSEQFADSDSDDDYETKKINKSAVLEDDDEDNSDKQSEVIEPIESTPKSASSNGRRKTESGNTTEESTKTEPEYITISSDDDTVDFNDDDKNFEIQEILILSSHKSNQPAQPLSNSLNNSIHDDEPMELKVMIAGEYRRFPTTFGSPLYDAFRLYIQELRQDDKTLIITLNGKQVPLEQSALELEINQGTILHGVECSKSMFTDKEPDTRKTESIPEDPNLITVKLQDGNQRNTREIKIGKTEPLVELKKKYASLMKIEQITSFKLKFDGDAVDEDETPIDLDLEGGEAFDVIRC